MIWGQKSVHAVVDLRFSTLKEIQNPNLSRKVLDHGVIVWQGVANKIRKVKKKNSDRSCRKLF